MSDSRSKLLPYAEGRLVLSSFLSSNNESECFGRFRIPKSFHDKFGKHIPKRLRFNCNLIEWKGNYDRKLRRIYGMGRFMKYYEIKIYGAVQFDYYGEDEFRVRIFKNTATETIYRKMSPSKFLNSKKNQNWEDEEYFIDGISLNYHKASALWSFNAFMNYVDHFEMKINNVHIDQRFPYMRLSKEFKKLYKHWEDGGQVFLRLGEKTWDINVKWIENTCAIGQRWYTFVEECQLEVGDTLVLFRIPSSDFNTVNVCLFKGKEQRIDDRREKIGVFERSFLKVVSAHFLVEGVMFVPKTIKDKYAEKLCCTNQLEIFGEVYTVSYNSTGGYLSQFEEIIQRFNLQEKDTIVFRMNESNVLHARIYQMDGREIDFDNRSIEDSDDREVDWVWSLHGEFGSVYDTERCNNLRDEEGELHFEDFSDRSDVQEVIVLSDDDECNEPDNEELIENNEMNFNATLKKSHVDQQTHGVYIPKFMWPIYQSQRKRKNVDLRVGEREWNVDVLRSQKLFRFSRGWDSFTKDNGLVEGQVIRFEFVGNSTFEVRVSDGCSS